jgi:hypothetical protein
MYIFVPGDTVRVTAGRWQGLRGKVVHLTCCYVKFQDDAGFVFQSKRENVEPVEFTYDSDSDADMIGDSNDDQSNPSTKAESFKSLSYRERHIWFIKLW